MNGLPLSSCSDSCRPTFRVFGCALLWVISTGKNYVAETVEGTRVMEMNALSQRQPFLFSPGPLTCDTSLLERSIHKTLRVLGSCLSVQLLFVETSNCRGQSLYVHYRVNTFILSKYNMYMPARSKNELAHLWGTKRFRQSSSYKLTYICRGRRFSPAGTLAYG